MPTYRRLRAERYAMTAILQSLRRALTAGMHGIVETPDDKKARASPVILLVSCFNLMLAVPTTWCMIAQQSGGL
jgi:hypothetical protein